MTDRHDTNGKKNETIIHLLLNCWFDFTWRLHRDPERVAGLDRVQAQVVARPVHLRDRLQVIDLKVGAEQRDVDRRHGEEHGDALALDFLDHRVRHEATEQHQGRAGLEARRPP